VLLATLLKLGYFSSCAALTDKVYVAYHGRRETQNEADMFCRERGGQLATIMNRDEQNHIKTELHSEFLISIITGSEQHWISWLSGRGCGWMELNIKVGCYV